MESLSPDRYHKMEIYALKILQVMMESPPTWKLFCWSKAGVHVHVSIKCQPAPRSIDYKWDLWGYFSPRQQCRLLQMFFHPLATLASPPKSFVLFDKLCSGSFVTWRQSLDPSWEVIWEVFCKGLKILFCPGRNNLCPQKKQKISLWSWILTK